MPLLLAVEASVLVHWKRGPLLVLLLRLVVGLMMHGRLAMGLGRGALVTLGEGPLFVLLNIVNGATILGLQPFLFLRTHRDRLLYVPFVSGHIVVDHEVLELFWQQGHHEMD